MPTRDQWMTATGLFGPVPDAVAQAVRDHVASVKLDGTGDDLYHLVPSPIEEPEARVIGVLAGRALDLEQLTNAAALAGVHVAQEVDDGRALAALADWLAAGQLHKARHLIGLRYKWDTDEHRARIAAEAIGPDEWSGLRLAAIAIDRTPSPRTFPWADKWRTLKRFSKVRTETSSSSTGYTEEIVYSDADGTPYVTTIRTYTAGRVGPASHIDTHRAHRTDGSYLEWTDPGPRVYSSEESSAVGRRRREAHVDRLIGELATTIDGAGGDSAALLTALHRPSAAGPSVLTLFREVGEAAPLLATVQAESPAVALAVAASLAPWLPA